MLVGYARVSTQDQSLDSQMDALTSAGCEKIYTDKASGLKDTRPGLQDLLSFIRPGDTLVVYRLDRLGRNLKNLIAIVEELKANNIGMRFLSEGIDTTTSGGTLVFNLFASIAQFERDVIKERTMMGLASAKARGRIGGRKPKLSDGKINHAVELYNSGVKTIREICDIIGISKAQLYDYLRKQGGQVVWRNSTEKSMP